MRAELQISPKIIHWIADLEQITPQVLADELAPKKADDFLNGILTKTTATKLAKRANIPFGYLFLQTPPKIQKPDIPDLRQVVGAEPLSKDFFDVLQDIRYKQDWFKDYLIEQGHEALSFVGKFQLHEKRTPNDVARDILKTLGINNLLEQIKKLRRDDYFKFLTKEFERIGILVFKSGVVKHNNSRTLSVNEFRGFALVDPIAPVIFINGSDYQAAQLFTLIHEVAHIWIGVSGVSSWNQEQNVESFCNKVAAEFLMPTVEFCRYWQADNREQSIEVLVTLFKVSRFAIIIKAVTLGLLAQSEIAKEREKLRNLEKSNSSGGGDFHNTVKVRQSPRFSDTVINQAISQHIPLREAGKLLNIRADTLMAIYRKRQGKV
ncbi:ImmA/IrrE family metallo-endopeptidase [Conservatibacter flavescens]|uniref:Zn peptidase n=1 Tax=Conservatibacter flavescens TaxID=28161 RepID=A0A2M8S2V9_9PAST|nr:ImmA/IrrE family metallo-endopeptidase [Conservatibacter flavescens]PJG85447.1 Zn peptidase [Conservatibacter flavescens]